MKKIVIALLLGSFLFNFLSVSSYAIEDIRINLDLPQDEHIERQLTSIYPIVDLAIKNNDVLLYLKASEMGYRIPKSGKAENIKIYNDFFSASAIEYSLQRYDLTKNKKFLNRAYKWSKIAIKDKTTQIYSIRAAIILAGYKLNTKNMIRAYDLYRSVDPTGAENFKIEFDNAYAATQELKLARKEANKVKWRNCLCILGLGLSAGATGYANGYNNAYRNYYNYNHYPTTYSTTTRQVGNTLYSTTTSY